MHENTLNDEHVPHEELQDNSIESSQLMSAILLTGVCFFFSQLNFDSRNLII